MYKFFLTIRYLRKRIIAYFAIFAVALCVFMVLLVHSVMSGFLDTVRNNSRRLLGDVILEIGGMESFPYYDEFIAELDDSMGSEIVAATPVIINAGLMKILGGLERDRTTLTMVNGIRLHEYRRINSFGEGLYYDKYFPGTTTFAETAQPLWHWNENQVPQLPSAYEDALSKYRQAANDADFVGRFQRQAMRDYPGPGHFRYAMEDDLLDFSTTVPEYSGKPRPGIVLGIELVARRISDGTYVREVPKGALVKLTVLSLTQEGSLTAAPATTAALRYVDDSRTKIYDIDKNNVYCDFAWLQSMLGYDAKEYTEEYAREHDLPGPTAPGRATQIQIKLVEGADYNAAAKRIEGMWQDFTVRMSPQCEPRDAFLMKYMMVMTWEERNADFILAVEKERILVLILFAIISGVAVLMIGCIFYMIVQEKTREIGIIRSMGATAKGVAAVFVIYGFGIGVVGSAIGTLLGVFFVKYINEIQEALAQLDPQLRVWSPEVYAFDRIPDTVDPMDATIIVAVAIVASMLGALAAALKAATIWPVDAIRYE